LSFGGSFVVPSSVWVPLGILLGDLFAHFKGLWSFAGWQSLSSETYISRFGRSRVSTCLYIFPGVDFRLCFLCFYVIFCDLGSPLELLWGSLATPFRVNRAPGFWMGSKVVPGPPKRSLLSAFGHHLELFLVLFRRI